VFILGTSKYTHDYPRYMQYKYMSNFENRINNMTPKTVASCNGSAISSAIWTQKWDVYMTPETGRLGGWKTGSPASALEAGVRRHDPRSSRAHYAFTN